MTTSNLRIRGRVSKAHRTYRHRPLPTWCPTHKNWDCSAQHGYNGTLGNVRTGRWMQSSPRFRHTPDHTLSHRRTLPVVLVWACAVWSPLALLRATEMGTSIGETGERSRVIGDRSSEDVENRELGERGEEDHIKDGQVLLWPSPSEACAGRGVQSVGVRFSNVCNSMLMLCGAD